MTEGPIPAIRALSTKSLNDLAAALREERLTQATSVVAVRCAVPAISEAAAVEVTSLLALGLGVHHAALLLDALRAEQARRRDAVELVTSGPDIIGSTRDTGVVLRGLFAEAERRVLVVGFAVHQGREIFAVLANRMRERPDLAVRLCLDVRRAAGDTTRDDALLRRFADRFLRHEWPGPRLPKVFYDPRSLTVNETSRASLHAKCVVVDGTKAFIGSANFTEAAQLRNIEVGVVVDRPETAAAVEGHFEALIVYRHLRRLELAR